MGSRHIRALVVTCILGGTFAAAAVSGTASARPSMTIAAATPATAATAATGSQRVVAAVRSGRTIRVTRADDGRSYRLRIGSHLDVQLSGPSDITWTEPSSSDQAVLRRTGGSSGVTASGTFTGNTKGTVTVTASGDNENCPACLGPIFGFEVTVSIVN